MSDVAAADRARGEAALLSAIERLARDAGQHLLTDRAQESDLAGLERTLEHPLPASFRTYLSRLGAGILYDRHEVFGPQSLQLHDIEFVPSLPAVLKQLRGAGLDPRLLPFHRDKGRVHAFDLGGGAKEPVPVRAMDGSARYPDLAAFLESVVLAAR